MAYSTFDQLKDEVNGFGLPVADVIAEHEAHAGEKTVDEIRASMHEMLEQMRGAIDYAFTHEVHSRTGLTGGDSAKIHAITESSDVPIVLDDTFAQALAASLATGEVNASMGRIVAAPTAGSAGVLPGTLLAIAGAHGLGDDRLVDGLLVAGAIGEVFAATSTLSGAAGGCQAEIGVAAAMTAGAICAILGGSIEQVGNAAALAMQGLLGLVCDPVSGLVEIPCVVRNATGSAVALSAAQMALAGVEFPIPLDEVVVAASRIGSAIDTSLRETALGGLAATPTAQKLCDSLN